MNQEEKSRFYIEKNIMKPEIKISRKDVPEVMLLRNNKLTPEVIEGITRNILCSLIHYL